MNIKIRDMTLMFDVLLVVIYGETINWSIIGKNKYSDNEIEKFLIEVDIEFLENIYCARGCVHTWQIRQL